MDKRTNKLIHALGSYHVTFARLVSAMMAALLLVTTMPALPAYASPSLVVPEGAGPPHLGLSPAHEHIRGGPHKIEKIVPRLSFSEHPSDLEISNARVLPEALVAMTGPGVSGENDALAKALVATKQKGDPENLSDLTAFIKEFPHSRWVPSLQLNLALIRFETGYLSDSMKLLRSSWEGAKNEKGLAQRAVADRAVAKLMLMCTRLGLVSDLKNLFAETDGRGFYGSDEEMVRDSKHGYWVMEHKPETAFRCGPCAIDSILSQMKKSSARSEITKNAKSTCNGTNLAQVKGWASQAGLNLQMAKRSPGAPVPVPAIMHWAVGHFAAIVEKRDGHYILKDSTFDTDLTLALSDAGLEQATDGYFLVPAGQLPKGWRTVSDEEAQTVWGKGGIGGYDPNAKYPPAPEICLLGGGSGGGVGGMARASCWTMSGSLNIVDVPLSYKPPLGPSMDFRINYSEGESNQPATFTFTNLGPDWTFGWLSYLSVNAMSSVATVRLRTGGSEVYTPSGGVYTNDILTQALLVNEGGGVYQRQLPDGSVEVYSQPDGSGNIFLTEVIDPQGNSALIQYDAHMRITSITDAINQVSTISYVSNTVGNSGFYKVASVSDPFGRTCSFTYDSTNTNLLSSTDSIGLVSKFNYDTSSTFITAMTTPYGTTGFYQYAPNAPGGLGVGTGVRFNLPDGSSAALESYWGGPSLTFFWNREQLAQYPEDPANFVHTHCSTTSFYADSAGEAAIPAYIIPPLESQTSYLYQTASGLPTTNKPSQVTTPTGSQSVEATIGGTITSGDTISIITYDPINNSNISAQYTTTGTDTTSTIATGLAAQINSNTTLATLGVAAAAQGAVVSVGATYPSVYFNSSVSGAATETVTILAQALQTVAFTLSGTPTTGDLLEIIFEPLIKPTFGASETVSYTVLATDTISSIATKLTNAINADTTLQANMTSASLVGTTIYVSSYNGRVLVFSPGTNYTPAGVPGATEKMALGAVTNGAQSQSNFLYNSFGHVTQAIDPMRRTFTYEYEANNIDLEQVTETQGTDDFQIGAWTWNSAHRPLTYTDGSGQVSTYSYNSSGELTKIVDAAGDTTTLTYTGTCTATVGGTVTSGNVLTITTHDAGLTGGQEADSYTVQTGDTLTSIATGLKNAINADVKLQAIGVSATSSGAVVTLSSTSTNVTSYTESTSGGATETIALGVNTFGYLTQINGPLSGNDDITTFTWDSVGRLASVTDSEGYQVQYGYDNADRLLLTTYPDLTTEQIIYDRLDAALRKDRIGRWTQDSFDVLDQLAYEIDPLGRKTQYTWCICGSLGSLTDPNGNTTNWSHDLEGRVVNKTYADKTSVNYVYETSTSRLHSKTDALNQTTVYFYNPDNTPFQVSYQNAVNPTGLVTYAWDPNYRRLSSVQKSDWGTISYTYNAYDTPGGGAITGGGMLQKVHNNVIANSDVTYTYDSLGRTTNRSINGASNSVGWTYDAMSRITQEVNELGTFGYSYVDNVSGSSKGTLRLSSISYPNSQTTNFSWYPTVNDERLQQISNLTSSGGTLSQFNYQYDSAGEITQWQQQQNGGNLFYNLGYDAAGQLTSAQAGSGSPRWPYAKEFYYNYDSGANRTGVQQTSLQTLRIGGTKTTGNTLTVTVKDPALSGGSEAVTYTVLAADTLATIAAGLATAINTDTHLQALGVIANAHGTNTFINIRSVSSNNTTYSTSTSGGATETMTFGIFQNGTENATVGGTKTTGDVLTLTVHDAALTGGQEAVTYTVLTGDTLTTIATGLKSAVNADAHLSTLGVTATSASTVVSINSNSTNVTSYTESVSAGATETIALAVNQNPTEICIVGGTVTTSDVLKINFYDAGLTGGTEAISYTVGAGNTLTQIATGLTSAINADTHLQGIGVSATSSGANITIVSNSTNATTYRQSYGTSTTTESLSLTTPTYGWQVAAIGGTKTTSDVLKIIVFDSALSTGSETVSYTVAAGDTLTSIATNIAAAINADSNLSNIGVTASSSSTVVSIESVSPNLTTYTESVSSGATETIALGSSIGATQSAYNSVNELTATASGGAADFQGTTDKPVKSATVSSQVISISATPPVPSSFSASFTATPTETVTIAPFPNNDPAASESQSQYSITFGGTVTVGDTLSLTIYDVRLYNGSETLSYTTKSGDTTTSICTAFYYAVVNDTNLYNLDYDAGPTANELTVYTEDNYKQAVNNIALSDSIVGAASETVTLTNTADMNVNATIGGTVHAGDVVSVTATNPDLTNGPETAAYTVVGTDTTTTIATGLTSAINADTHLQAIGVGATSSSNVVSVTTDTSYTDSHSAGATETITLGTDSRGNCTATIGGKPTTSDTVTITAHNNALSGGQEAVTYTVLSTDTLQSIAAGLAAAMTSDAHLQTLGVSASSGFPATLATTQNFSGKALLPTGASAANASAVDGGSNSKSNGYQLSVPTGTSTSLTYDLDGNMLTDGLGNSYSWDAENRLIKIVYPGSGNNSQFTFDGFGRNVEIVETVSGSVTSTKQMVWASDRMRPNQPCEARNSAGTITAQYFPLGETISGTDYFYTTDHLGSIEAMVSAPGFWQLGLMTGHPSGFNPVAYAGSTREMTNSSGTVESQLAYDPYGRVTQLQGSMSPDCEYAGYYLHAPSGLSLTATRAYHSGFGRFINRDSIEEAGGTNLFAYTDNDPIKTTDQSGLQAPVTLEPITADPTLPFSGPFGSTPVFPLMSPPFSVRPPRHPGDFNKCIEECMQELGLAMLQWIGQGGADIAPWALAQMLDECVERCMAPPPRGGGTPIKNFPAKRCVKKLAPKKKAA